MGKGKGGSYAASRVPPAAPGQRGRAPARTEKDGSTSISAAYLLWLLELQCSKVPMPGLLLKDTGPVPSRLWKVSQRDSVGFIFPFSPCYCFPFHP